MSQAFASSVHAHYDRHMKFNSSPFRASGFLRFALAGAAAALVGCSPSPQQAEIEALRQRVTQLEGELSAAQAKAMAPAASSPSSTPSTPAASASTASSTADGSDDSAWDYRAREDKMTGGTTYSATATSVNTVNFDFPYNGEQNGRLTLRRDPKYGKDVILAIEKGQILCPAYDGCTVMVRFDNGKPEAFSAVGTADGSTEAVFIQNYDRFLQKMRKAKIARLSVNIYQQGAPVFEFYVGGFNPDRLTPKGSKP